MTLKSSNYKNSFRYSGTILNSLPSFLIVFICLLLVICTRFASGVSSIIGMNATNVQEKNRERRLEERSYMVGEMVQNSQSLYSFTFNAVIVIHEYIYSHSTTNFTLKKYIYSHLMMYFLFTNIFTHIYEIYLFTFNGLYSFTFTIEIFIHHFLRTAFCASLGSGFRSIISERNMADEG